MNLDRRFSVNGTGEGENNLPDRNRKADEQLAIRFDQLAQKWAEAEKYFRALHLPHTISVHYNKCEHPGEPEEPLFYSWELLGFLRYGDKWRLCHGRSHSLDEAPPLWKPIVECCTDVRIEAVSQLGWLKIEAAKAKEEYVAKVEKAVAEIDTLLSD